MHFTLEQHRFFPYIAWTLCIGFAVFVGNLALQLSSVTTELASDTNRLESIANDNTGRIDLLEAELERLKTKQ